MSTSDKYLTYRGELRAIATSGDSLIWVTEHAESLPTALYRLAGDKLDMTEIALPTGGVSLAVSDDSIWIGGTDKRLYQLAGKAKAVEPVGEELPAVVTKLALLANDRIAAICEKQLVILDRSKGKQLQTIEITEKATALAADPSGEWLAVGTSKGEVSIFECEEKKEFLLSESAKLHEGAVTALLFEPEELRFFSAGADQKLLLTHARGKLEPEDRGRGNTHSEPITAMLHVLGERFITGSSDKSVKTWTRSGGTRPATLTDGVPAVVDLATITIHERPHLAIAGSDNTIRLFLLDAGGRFRSATHRLYDAYDRAAHLLRDTDVARRGEALHALAEYNDQRSLEQIGKHSASETDPALRLRAAELLAAADHPRAAKLLEPMLTASDSAVRLAALEGLLSKSTLLRGETLREKGLPELHPLSLALAAEQADIGTVAVKHLIPLAKSDDQARRLLVSALDNSVSEVRRAALLAIEKVFDKESPEATLIAAGSTQAETRRLALVRAYQRKLLDNSRVEAAIRRCGTDAEADVRRMAFLVSLMSRAKLAKAVRERDKELHRQLFELESFEVEPKKSQKPKEPPKVKPVKFKLDEAEYRPLLSAMSSQSIDTSLLGARCLALLGDSRAFGLLLQLSLEEQPSARVEVCRALEALGDRRAAQRLESLINDSAAEVRDAAYSALAKLGKKEPLTVAEAGLGSEHADIRRRALQTLVAALRKSTGGRAEDIGRGMLLVALNDSEQSVRGEALKSALNLQIGGDQPATLRFLLGSVHATVRKEVLTEAMAEDKQPWAWELLLELFNDPDESIRRDAFEHANKKKKGHDLEVLRAALDSHYADVRQLAVASLVKLGTKPAQEALVDAINDTDQSIRGEALDALIDDDAVDALHAAMQSKHADVRLGAASARAFYRDPAAREPLLTAATAEKPEKADDQAIWIAEAKLALEGLAILGDPDCVEPLLPLLDSQAEEIRRGAAKAIAWSAREPHVELLKKPLQHSDRYVKYRIALGLALLREPIAGPLVFSAEASEVLVPAEILVAAAGYGEAGEQRLLTLLDSETPWIRNATMLVLLFRDWLSHDGTPGRLLAALATRSPRIRLAAARALEVFADREAYRNEIVRLVNDRGQEKPWEVEGEYIDTLARLIVFAAPHTAAEAIECLESLAESKPDRWNFLAEVFPRRYAAEIEAADKEAGKSKLPKLETSAEELTEIAFGAYVGLVREQGSFVVKGRRPGFGATIESIRQSAIRRLTDMATANAEMLSAARPVLVQALSDRLREVRQTAFEKLLELGVENEEVAEAALESGVNDIAVEGLKLLTKGAGKKGQQILRDVITTRDDQLARESVQLLRELAGTVQAAEAAIESPNHVARGYGIFYLANEYADNKAAPAAMRKALKSRYDDVRLLAAGSLARHKDKVALPALTQLLSEPLDRSDHRRVITAIEELGDPTGVDVLLDRLDNDPDATADVATILYAVGRFREPKAVPRLLPRMERTGPQRHVHQALLMISGYDQRIVDPNDDRPERDWLEKEHPRHHDVLAAVMQQAIDTRRIDWLRDMVPMARWSLAIDVDPVLAQLTVHSDDKLRHAAVEAIGWRLKHRDGSADSLVSALEHRDPTTKFLAAEGLANGGRGEGISVLLSAIELLSDLHLRRRAVLALGELADLRAVDVLLKLASDETHALNEVAAEAIGHMGKSDQSDEILKLLVRLAKSDGSVSKRAIVGLRWLDTAKGWDVLRELARDEEFVYRSVVLEQLGYNDDPATRDLLLEIIRGEHLQTASILAARRLFGEESLEPDYAVMMSGYSYDPNPHYEQIFGCLRRILERGEPDRIFEALPTAGECFEPLAFHLTSLDPLPKAAAAAALTSPDAATVTVAAQVIGRTGDKSHGKAIAAAISDWLARWDELESKQEIVDCDSEQQALLRLAWAAGSIGSAKSELFTLAGSHVEHNAFAKIRAAALGALTRMKLTKADLVNIDPYVDDPDSNVRRKAAELLAQQKPAEAAALAGQMVSDRRVFNRLLASEHRPAVEALNEAAANVHYQPIVLPHLIADGEVAPLVEVATNDEQGEATRFGAIEGLASMVSEEAEQELALIGGNESFDEEIRRAAWRGLKRSKRRRVEA